MEAVKIVGDTPKLPPFVLREPKVTKTTIAQRGAVLPLGSESGGRSVAVRDWRMREERELGALRKENENANMAKYVAIVLGHMCTSLGGNDFVKETDPVRKHLSISMMWVPDVFYAYIYLRIKAMSEKLKVKLKSPYGGEPFDWTADLTTTEVACCEKLADAQWLYQLEYPFELRGKKVTQLLFGPQKWNALENLASNVNIGAAKALVVISSLHGVPELGDNVLIDESELDDMAKPDIERIAGYINDYGIGADMTMEAKDHAGRPFNAVLDWTYDSFFGSSSQ